MDTIDISNLNRQFLFRRKHVGQPKSVVARESALLYTADASECDIIAHHDDVKTLKYGPEYIKQFDIVLNALDNLSARRHVGRVCWSAGTPYVESGTAGWLGQVQPFIPGKTGCYECETKTPPTTFPVCTIRSNPSRPIHTIMWAKHLFNLLFGKPDEENAVTSLQAKQAEDSSSTEKEAASSTSSLPEALLKQIEEDLPVLQGLEANSTTEFSTFIFHKIFYSDILTVNTLTNLWTERAPPTAYTFTAISEDEKFSVAPSTNTTVASNSSASSTTLEDQKMWSLQRCAETFMSTCTQLKAQSAAAQESGGLSWDKDEPLHLDFVVAASNLRSFQYGIPMQSKFSIKSDAGNIIPAIATTNAVIAGLIVIEAVKIITGRYDQSKSVYLAAASRTRSMLRNESKPYKNPSCYVCSNQFVDVKIDTTVVTLKTFLEEVLIKQLGVLEASIIVGDDIVYEFGDEDLEPQLAKTLDKVKIQHSSIVHAESFAFDFKLEIAIQHAPAVSFEDSSKPYKILGSVSPPAAPKEATEAKESKEVENLPSENGSAVAPSAPSDKSSTMDVDNHKQTDTSTAKPAVTIAPGTEIISLDDDDDDDDLIIIDAPPAPTKKRSHDEQVPSAQGDDEEAPEPKRVAV